MNHESNRPLLYLPFLFLSTFQFTSLTLVFYSTTTTTTFHPVDAEHIAEARRFSLAGLTLAQKVITSIEKGYDAFDDESRYHGGCHDTLPYCIRMNIIVVSVVVVVVVLYPRLVITS